MSRTLLLSIPNSPHTNAIRVFGFNARDLVRATADAIRAYAARKGIAVRAVEYEIAR